MNDQTKRIRSAVTDGRAHSPRYIQRQLGRLHEVLREHRHAIRSAICRDSDYTSAEASTEIYLALKAVRQDYEATDLTKFLESEYSIAHGKANLSRRLPIGCVYITPSQHSRLYSTIQPASAAIAAGNCVMIEVSKNIDYRISAKCTNQRQIGQTTSELGSLLRKILPGAMDKDTFGVVESKPSDEDWISRQCVVIDGKYEPATHTSHSVLSAPPSSTIAVVDRTSNVSEAAQQLVRARFSFRGSSPYSPDIVLVNEFVLEEFCSCAAKHVTEHLGSNMPNENIRTSKTKSDTELQRELQKSSATRLISGSRGSIVLVQER